MIARTCPTCLTPISGDAAFCSACGAPSVTRILTPTSSGGGRSDLSSSSYATQPDRLQRALGPHYELGPLIGRGGYAEVFAVRDRKLNRELAIKVLRPDLIVTKSLLARFRREAEAVGALRHPGIVPVYDVGDADGIGFIVMPLIHGESLKRRLLAERRLPVEETRRILLEAADALSAAHAAGVVHRDIKPENIMLEGPDRRVRIMDFGIAKAVDTADHQLTATGVIVGTPQYMSPEQACGDPQVDHRSDQYSLAVVGYQMLSGQVPFEGETARAVMAKQMLDEPPPLWKLVDPLPESMMDALERALAKDPGRRFPSITAFATALERPSGPALPARQRASRKAARKSARGSPPWMAWATGALAIALAGVAVTQWSPNRTIRVPVLETTFVPSRPIDSTPVGRPGLVSQSGQSIALPPPAMPPAPAPAESVATPPEPVSPVVQPAPAPPSAPADSSPPAPAKQDCLTSYQEGEWITAYALCPNEAGADPVAARYAGILLAEGQGGAADPQAALRFLRSAVERGDQASRPLLATQYLVLAQLAERADPSQSTEHYLAAAELGLEAAYPAVAGRLERGIGTPRDLARAAAWYERAAAGGHAKSQLRLGHLFTRGLGVARDAGQAAEWFRKAAQTGDPEGMYQYALVLLEGKGVARSDRDALDWLEKAATADHEGARRELARRRR